MEYDNRDSGALFKNDKRGNEKAPDYTGEYTTPEGVKRRLAAWIRESKSGKTYMSLKFSDMTSQAPPETQPMSQGQPDTGFDDIPF